MQVKGIETSRRNVTVEVQPKDAVVAIRETVYENLDIPITSEYLVIDNGQLVTYEDEDCGSHPDTVRTVQVASPSKTQLQVVELFNNLTNVVNTYSSKF